MSSNNNFFFVGPTAAGCANLQSALSDFTILPPVKRGDISSCAMSKHPGIIVIVDGMFHSCPSVGHAELRDAMKNGWTIWGLSSLGAIRACEMKEFGMKGFGQVYERYLQDDDFQDDEVALLHGPLPPYPAFTEPLIHLRAALTELEKEKLLTAKASAHIIQHLKSLWYGKRTPSAFVKLVLNAAPGPKTEAILADFERFRLKNQDLRNFLELRPWEKF
jgi:hypothetical protein